MRIVKSDVDISFVRYRLWAVIISVSVITVGMIALAIKGPNLGIDFAGGTLIHFKVKEQIPIGKLRTVLVSIGYADSLIQQFGELGSKEILIRLKVSTSEVEGIAENVKVELEKNFIDNTFEILRVEMVGPQVGKQLQRKGLWSIVVAMLGILIYVSWRFEFRFAVGAVTALIHDVLITVGIFFLTGKEFTLPVIAAILTIIGYSLNDTIVVFDRIRENIRLLRNLSYDQIVNRSINETLSRTILTSFTTLVVVLALFLYGGEVIHDFAFALIVGVIVGTYSSIFIASPILIIFQEKSLGLVGIPVRRFLSLGPKIVSVGKKTVKPAGKPIEDMKSRGAVSAEVSQQRTGSKRRRSYKRKRKKRKR